MRKYTPWFVAGQQNPVRVGVYQTPAGDYKHWDGRYWGWFARSPKRAEQEQCGHSGPTQTVFKWRGLTKPTGARK
jgi:hypothetical protein